jgi:hypothetical protein
MKYCAVFLLACLFCIGSSQALYNLPLDNYQTCIDNDGTYPANVGLVINSFPVSGVTVHNDAIGDMGTTPYQLVGAWGIYGYGQAVGPWIPIDLHGGPLGTNKAYAAFKVCPPPKITIITANLNPVMPAPTTTTPVNAIIVSKVTALQLVTLNGITTVTTTPTPAPAVTTTVTTTTTAAPVTTSEAQPQATAYVPPANTEQPTAAQQYNSPTEASNPPATQAGSGTQNTGSAAGTGSLSIITTPAGAAVYVDGVQVGVSPATIPGLAAGAHSIMLTLDGYEQLSSTVTIAAGQTQTYTTGLIRTNKTPGFVAAIGIAAIAVAAVLFLRKKRDE